MLSATLLKTATAFRQNWRAGTAAGVIINEHTLSSSATRAHVDTLGRSFDFIHHDALLDRLQHPKARPFCLLTFDDGKRSAYSETAPELERLGVPAVFYLTTRFLTENVPLWFDEYEALLASMPTVPAGLEPSTIKELPLAMIRERVHRACLTHGISPDMSSDTIRPMSWDDARDLVRRGFTVGAHSLRHAVLTRETQTAALRDIEESIADVSTRIGIPCRTFAFPNGNYTARLARHALQCGVLTVMTTEPVWADRQFPQWRLPRVQLFGSHNRSQIELKIALAAAGFVLRNPDGSGRLYRKIMRLSRSERSLTSGYASSLGWEAAKKADTTSVK
jgi:peptidoglycan/xylan/chitin deacetylase (PgdA/CDA1 family)